MLDAQLNISSEDHQDPEVRRMVEKAEGEKEDFELFLDYDGDDDEEESILPYIE